MTESNLITITGCLKPDASAAELNRRREILSPHIGHRVEFDRAHLRLAERAIAGRFAGVLIEIKRQRAVVRFPGRPGWSLAALQRVRVKSSDYAVWSVPVEWVLLPGVELDEVAR